MIGALAAIAPLAEQMRASLAAELDKAERERARWEALTPYQREHERQVRDHQRQYRDLHAPRVTHVERPLYAGGHSQDGGDCLAAGVGGFLLGAALD